jgi:hypothetical protein
MKKLLTISLLLLCAIAFTGCDKKTTIVVKNTSDYQISDIIIFCYLCNDQVDQIKSGSLGVGSTSTPIEVTSKIEKVAVSFKFYFPAYSAYSDRYITVNKYLVKSKDETVITIANDTYVMKYSDSKAPGDDNNEGFTIANLRIAE